MKVSDEERLWILQLRASLGRAAKRDGLAKMFSIREAIIVSVRTLLNQIENAGYPAAREASDFGRKKNES